MPLNALAALSRFVPFAHGRSRSELLRRSIFHFIVNGIAGRPCHLPQLHQRNELGTPWRSRQLLHRLTSCDYSAICFTRNAVYRFAVDCCNGKSVDRDVAHFRPLAPYSPLKWGRHVQRGRMRSSIMFAFFLVVGCENSSVMNQWFPDEDAIARDRAKARLESLVTYQIEEMAKDPRQVAHYCGRPYEGMQAPQIAHCNSRFWTMAWARIVERYTWADFNAVQIHCQGYPDDCTTLRNIELRIKDSDATRRAAAQAQIDAEQRRAVAQALADYGKSLQSRNVSCTSNTIGSSTYTHCN
jgi:hypothetical protein